MDIKAELNKYRANGFFKNISIKNDYVLVTCPFHNNGKERTPSMGIATKRIHKGNLKVEEGYVHCFGCGYKARFSKFLADIRGVSELEVLKEFTKDKIYINQRDFDIKFKINSKSFGDLKLNIDGFDEDCYEYLIKRNIGASVIEQFHLGGEDKKVIFPLLNKKDKVIGYQKRDICKKQFYNSEDLAKLDFLYGLNEVIRSNCKDYVIVVESIVDCLTCWSYGIPSVALMGSELGEYHLKELSKLSNKIILALDNDEVGKEANKIILEKFKFVGRVAYIFKWGNYGEKDINDLSKIKFEKILCKTIQK